MLEKSELLQLVRDVATDFVSVEPETIEPDAVLDDIGGWTSFAHINIMLLLEESANISFKTDDISSVETINDLIEIMSTATSQNS